MVFFSMMIAILLATLLAANFNQTFGGKLNVALLHNPAVIAILMVLVLVVSFIASGYPSTIMSKLKTTEILKGKITIKRKGGLRNALIVTQFVIAIVLICSTIIIYQQFNHLRTAPLGYNTSSIISIPVKNDENGKAIAAQMRNRLAAEPSVIAVSGGSTNLGVGEDHSTSVSSMCFTYGDKNVCGQILSADYDFLKTIGIKPIEGQDFSTAYANDSSRKVIVSESYAAQFGEKNIVGFSYVTDSGAPRMNVVGVIPDFQLMQLGSKQKPLVIELNRGENLSYVWVRVNTSNPLVTMSKIRQVYASIEPGVEFNGSYVNENIERWFTEEQSMASVFSIAAAIAIVLSCMGLFGIAAIVIRQRVKEIGVRKVLGASVNSIVALVGREFLKPVLIAFLIAVPISWWAMYEWLQSYSYRVDVQWWVFLIAGVAAVVITIATVSYQSIKAAIANPVKSLRTE
jgi:putative ABC transport system permease protein